VRKPPGYDEAMSEAIHSSHVNKPYPVVPREWPEPAILWQEIKNMLVDVKRDSSPGIPLVALGVDNNAILTDHELLLVKAVYNRLQLLANNDVRQLDAVQLVSGGFCDPVRLFVKQEPHSKEKVQTRRFRLIFSVSLVDQLVERFLCGPQNKAEISNWHEIASCPGMGLSLDSQVAHLWDNVQQAASVRPAASSDLKGFDWSVQGFELASDMEARITLSQATGLFAQCMRSRVRCLSLKVFCLSDGRLYAQLDEGIQASGSYNTSSTNSRVRVAGAFYVGSKWAKAMGDDALEEYTDGAVEKYLEIGKVVKEYTKFGPGEPFEFCSHIFREGPVAQPINWAKSLYRLLGQSADHISHLVDYLVLIRHTGRSPQIKEVLLRAGWCTEDVWNQAWNIYQNYQETDTATTTNTTAVTSTTQEASTQARETSADE